MNSIKILKKIITIVFLLDFAYSQYSEFYINPNFNHDAVKSVVVVADSPEFWIGQFLSNGYNVVDRNSLDYILEEKKLILSGLTANDDIKDLINADAIFIYNKIANYSDSIWNEVINCKLIFVSTGEIIFTSKYQSILLQDESVGDFLLNIIKYKNSVIPYYRSKTSDLKSPITR
ncbi:hypothetical protein [Candidatus Harpocratesius sp.]